MAALDTELPQQADVMHRLGSARALQRPQGFRPQELANVIWALATCGTGVASQTAQELASYCVRERLRQLKSTHC